MLFPMLQKQLLIHIQEDLFTIGSHLAADPEKNKMALPEVGEASITEDWRKRWTKWMVNYPK